MLEKPVRPTRIAKDSSTNRGHPQLFGPFFCGGEREEKKARGDESITSHPANEN